ncbi:MAG: hypothetical protein R2772_07645 [Chitinophagales bacterium]
MRLFLLALVLFVFFSCKEPVQSNFPTSKCSTLELVDEALTLKNFYFEEYGDKKFLAVSKFESLDDENSLANFEVYPSWPKQDSAKWDVKFKASRYQLLQNYLIAESEEDLRGTSYVMYNLENGNEVVSYTYDKFEVLFSSEEERRFIAFYSRDAANLSSSVYELDESSLGILSYVNQNGEGQHFKIQVQTTPNDYDISSPVLELLSIKENAIELMSGKTLYFTGEDGTNKNAVNFNIQVSFFTKTDYEERSFLLQVRNDVLLSNADLSPDLEFRLISLD